MSTTDTIQIAGAGPAGLAAAITFARAGRKVVVHEAHPTVGYRFGCDLQGVENWTSETDALDEWRQLGLATDFARLPCRNGTAFDARGRAYPVESRAPLFYMIERGPAPWSLDSALLAQAQLLGVEVRFRSRLDRLDGPGVLAVGPRAADAIAVGYHFDTTMPEGFWVICDDALAPKGYAYLLVLGKRGTVKSCMYSGFKEEQLYVRRTVEAFRRLIGLEMRNPQPHGGVGNFRLPVTARSGLHVVAGEQAGFQDVLWGFGIRLAVRSGVLAARSLIEGSDYDASWRREIGPLVEASIVDRALYGLVGNRSYGLLLRYQARGDAREFLRRHYGPSRLKRALVPWAKRRYRSERRDASCDHVECGCIWCRCGDAAA
ncbi:FAD-dependent pyridine nucleotide-disulfide oxidoreductase [Sulfurifustis variabilis]|uniref:FAD-dependent pyridine nucleotide-disulfide oxidoreductase n=1 Tax=Sulfurifustis variabilis TaxID=1675686 RepID=A0A1C7AF21_9GAMM|nr:NAD(P)-binding protein [Sulfurifustis variabilis]BAU49820.1 FAD-dependent pyridine nucleotide-disulfide oxidoreductase [Sulfurifustis variabilis]